MFCSGKFCDLDGVRRLLYSSRTVALFTGSWGIRNNRLGDWNDRVAPISKVFAVLFPAVIIGLLNAQPVIDSGAATIVVSYIASKYFEGIFRYSPLT